MSPRDDDRGRGRSRRHPSWNALGTTVPLQVLFVVCLLIAVPATAEDVDSARVLPTAPAVGEPLRLVLEGTWPTDCPPVFGREVDVDGHELTLYVSASPENPPPTSCGVEPTEYRASYAIPALDEIGFYDLEVQWIDTPFLPTMIAQVSFEVEAGGRIFLEVSSPISESRAGDVLIYGLWPDGCHPESAEVVVGEPSTKEVFLFSEIVRSECGMDDSPFALAVDLPILPSGAMYEVYWMVEERQTPDSTASDAFERASGWFDVAQAETRPLLLDGRFAVTVSVSTHPQLPPSLARLAPGSTSDTALFYFFDADNLEAQVKVLDACDVNDRFWVFAAASSDLAFEIRVEDLQTNEVRTYENAGGQPAVAVNDTDAFATCD